MLEKRQLRNSAASETGWSENTKPTLIKPGWKHICVPWRSTCKTQAGLFSPSSHNPIFPTPITDILIMSRAGDREYFSTYPHSHWSKVLGMLFCLLLFSCPVMSNSLQPHGLQHARPLCHSTSHKVCPRSLPWWCHPAISSSFCPQKVRGDSLNENWHFFWLNYYS